MITIWAKHIREVKNHTVAFLYSTKIESEKSTLEIVATNIYRILINGELIGYGPARAAHNYIRKDIYSLSRFIDKEINIVVEVFASNVNSYYIVDELPFFGAYIIFNNSTVALSTDFKAYLLTDRVTKIQRYSFQRPFAESYKMKKCRSAFYNGDTSIFTEMETEEVLCNKIINRDIDYPTFKPVDYTKEVEYGKVEINKENWKWEDRALKGIDEFLRGYKYVELDECISDEVSEFVYSLEGEKSDKLTINSNSYKLFDFGRTLTGFFKLKLKVLEKTIFYIIWDELIWEEDKPNQNEKNICFYRNTCCNIIKYSLEKGDYDLLAFEPSTARFAKIIVLNGEIEIDDFKILLYENNNVYNLKFECEDKKLQSIVQSAANTLAQNSVDVLMDCPSRERAGWLCDAYFSARAEKLFTGRNEIERNFLENYVLSGQLKELPIGMLPMCYPADHYNGVYIPNWSMWFVLELNDYYKRTGDKQLLQKSKDKIYKLIDFFKKYINEDGLLENLENWVFIEWSKCNDEEFIKGVNYPSNILYSAMLLATGQMYGDDELIVKSEEMKKTIIEQSFNGEFFEDNKVRENGELVSKNHLTETCQYYAIYFGLAKREEFPRLFEIMIKEFGPNREYEKVYPNVHKSNAIVGNYLRLEILLDNNLNQRVLDECKDFFYFMAQRTGTLWEHSYAYGSLNHGFASVAANYIIESTTGFVKANYIDKIIYLKSPPILCDTTVLIPIQDEYLKITILNNERTIEAPNNYKIEIMDLEDVK